MTNDVAGALAGRVALVTGAARGLGRAAAERLLAGGAQVALNVHRPEQAEALSRALGDGVLVRAGDVADARTVRDLVAAVLDRFGRLDVLVNNAAAAYSTRFERITEEEWRRALDVNLTAAFLCTQAAVPAMKAQGYGRVINLSSTAGKSVSTLGGAHYTASKAGLLGLTRAAAKELGPYGITVNAVCPGLIDTELTREHATPEDLAAYARSFPIQRLGTAAEVADLICFLASEQAGYITGASLDINGGDLMI
jgi:NAD(P)-dependent dehydrogenase (short-subunit alcohol dehydrogenase family)